MSTATATLPQVGFDADHFALLGLPRSFVLDREALEHAWRELQGRVHPDRFATGSQAERRIAMQWASRVNEAHRVLRSPLRRARYLCELAGHDVSAETNTAMAPAFLMQQLEWREALDDARQAGDADALDALERELQEARAHIHDAVARELHEPDQHAPNYELVVARVREWMFIERLFEEVDDARP